MDSAQPAGRDIRTLADVEEKSDFAKLYSHLGLSETGKKVDFLTDALKVQKIRTARPETPEERLLGLEEFVLRFPWHCSQ